MNSVLVPGLESGDPKYRVCLHYRDWTPGGYIQTQIDQSIEASSRTIVVLSNNFIENVWGQIEFKTAHSKALKDKTNRIIVIVFGEVGKDNFVVFSLQSGCQHSLQLFSPAIFEVHSMKLGKIK